MVNHNKKLLGFYLGIDKLEYPRWSGWIIIREYCDIGVRPRDIDDLRLDCLVQNFHFLIELSKKFGVSIK